MDVATAKFKRDWHNPGGWVVALTGECSGHVSREAEFVVEARTLNGHRGRVLVSPFWQGVNHFVGEADWHTGVAQGPHYVLARIVKDTRALKREGR